MNKKLLMFSSIFTVVGIIGILASLPKKESKEQLSIDTNQEEQDKIEV